MTCADVVSVFDAVNMYISAMLQIPLAVSLFRFINLVDHNKCVLFSVDIRKRSRIFSNI